MEILTSSFLGAFLLLYSLLHPIFLRPVFATYVVILLIIGFCSVKLYQYLKTQSLAKTDSKEKLRLGILWTVQVYLTMMMVWYIFVHFKTHAIM